MTLDEYQKKAMRTCNVSGEKAMRTHARYGLISEAGEIAGLFQKEYQGHVIDKQHLLRELGDLVWFAAELCHSHGFGLEKVVNSYQLHELVIEMRETAKIDDLVLSLCGYAFNAAKDADSAWSLMQNAMDILIYVARIADRFYSSIDDVMQINIDKLLKRFPDGFEAERSLHRSEGDV